MNKRSISIGLAAVAMTTGLSLATAAPASAADPTCGTYPAGQDFQLSIRANQSKTRVGSTIVLSGTLVRGGEYCADVDGVRALQASNIGQRRYRFRAQGITSGQFGGLLAQFKVTNYYSYYYFSYGGETSPFLVNRAS